LSTLVVARLIVAQFATGSSYPAFSSLRSDPLGTKVLYDVIETLGRKPARSYIPLNEQTAQDATVFVLGVHPQWLAAMGSHKPSVKRQTVVLGLAGDCVPLELKAWAVKTQCADKAQSFSAPEWNVINANSMGQARAISRRFGETQVILLADSRMLNNGSLLRNRRTELIAYLLEQNHTVLFDEEHLGVTDAGSVGLLIRRYRLYWVIAAALFIFGLFVWKNSSSFLPREEIASEEIGGRDSAAAMANLLHRTVPRSELIPVAIAQWAKSAGKQDRQGELTRIAAQHSDPADAYRAISRALAQKRNP
jgi:hypothetical protein